MFLWVLLYPPTILRHAHASGEWMWEWRVVSVSVSALREAAHCPWCIPQRTRLQSPKRSMNQYWLKSHYWLITVLLLAVIEVLAIATLLVATMLLADDFNLLCCGVVGRHTYSAETLLMMDRWKFLNDWIYFNTWGAVSTGWLTVLCKLQDKLFQRAIHFKMNCVVKCVTVVLVVSSASYVCDHLLACTLGISAWQKPKSKSAWRFKATHCTLSHFCETEIAHLKIIGSCVQYSWLVFIVEGYTWLQCL